MTHLKRYAVSLHYPIKKKESVFALVPKAGPHGKEECIPLGIILRDILGYAKTAKEAKKILNSGEVKIDGRIRKDPKYPCGLMDVIEIEKIKEYFRIIPKKGRLVISKITQEKSKKKLCQIKNKTTIKKGKIQLNLHDGRNIIVDVKNPKKPTEDKYKVGDILSISIPEQKILNVIKFEKGNLGLISKGKHAGKIGKIEDIKITIGGESNKVVLKVEGDKILTIKDYVFVIGKDKPEILVD